MVLAARSTVLNPRELRLALALSRERMARIFDVSAKTIELWESQNSLPSGTQAAEVFSQLQEIVELGRQVYTAEGLRRFLTTPMPVFSGRTALKLFERGDAELVLSALAADYEGLGA
jgi:DNA-binding XRE family transcriptional regulator